ncbi:hypothetical protein HA466_0134810 [Hirschfeldia incana]|nr:hypothetical protein HA466_0134810 [Hirschfeldia incana]
MEFAMEVPPSALKEVPPSGESTDLGEDSSPSSPAGLGVPNHAIEVQNCSGTQTEIVGSCLQHCKYYSD